MEMARSDSERFSSAVDNLEKEDRGLVRVFLITLLIHQKGMVTTTVVSKCIHPLEFNVLYSPILLPASLKEAGGGWVKYFERR